MEGVDLATRLKELADLAVWRHFQLMRGAKELVLPVVRYILMNGAAKGDI